MKKLLTILGSLGMIVPVSASVVACNGSDDKETLRSSDQWGDGWGDENKQRPANPDDNWNDWDDDDWDDIGDAGGRPVTPGDEDDNDNDWGNDRDEDNDDENNDSTKSFQEYARELNKLALEFEKIKCDVRGTGVDTTSKAGLAKLKKNNPKVAKSYSQVWFDMNVLAAEVFLKTDASVIESSEDFLYVDKTSKNEQRSYAKEQISRLIDTKSVSRLRLYDDKEKIKTFTNLGKQLQAKFK